MGSGLAHAGDAAPPTGHPALDCALATRTLLPRAYCPAAQRSGSIATTITDDKGLIGKSGESTCASSRSFLPNQPERYW